MAEQGAAVYDAGWYVQQQYDDGWWRMSVLAHDWLSSITYVLDTCILYYTDSNVEEDEGEGKS